MGKTIEDKAMTQEAKTHKTRYPAADALAVAKELCRRLAPWCERIVIAGSLRRRMPTVGDVEILYVPRMEEVQADLFTTTWRGCEEVEIRRMLLDGTLTKREGIGGHTAWGNLNKLAVHTASGIPVDLFRTTEACWYNYLVCRTGPAALNTRIATEAQRRGYRWAPYGPGFSRISDGAMLRMESEAAVFAMVGLPNMRPQERNADVEARRK